VTLPVDYLALDEPEITSPIIASSRPNDRSPLLAHILNLIGEFEQWPSSELAGVKA